MNVGDFVHISTGAIINGKKIGSYSFIGSGSVIHNGIEIGDNCIVGAGKVIKRNLKSFSIIK